MSRQITPGFINQAQRPELPLSLTKTEPLLEIKNEPAESNEDIISDIKDVDIVSHLLCEDSIKSETLPENIFETKHSESLEFETLVFAKSEIDPLVKIENLTENENLYKTEDTFNKIVNEGTDQEIEVQGSNENNLEINEQLVFNLSNDSDGINIRSRKSEHIEKTDFAKCYKTCETTSWEKDKLKIKVINKTVIPVEPHEYVSLNKDQYFCNHCHQEFTTLDYIKRHIKTMHREVTRMYQCPYCAYKSKWTSSLQRHVIQKHKDTKDIQWFQCHLCEKKFKLKSSLTEHTKVHLTHEQMQDRMKFCPVCGKGFKARSSSREHMKFVHNKEERNKMERKCQECEYTTTKYRLLKYHIKSTHEKHEKRYRCEKCPFGTEQYTKFEVHELTHKTKAEMDDRDLKYRCDKCDFKTFRSESFKKHKVIHLKPEEIQYFYCYHCSYKSKQRDDLKSHIWRHFKKENVPFHCYICDFVTLKRKLIIEHIQMHSGVADTKKCEKKYCCEKCAFVTEHHSKFKQHKRRSHKRKAEMDDHELKYRCDKCDYKNYLRQNLNMHKLIHLKPEERQYLYCYHCSYKSNRRNNLTAHIARHFKNEDVPFHCYVCDFVTLKRDLIMEHVKKHSNIQIKSEIE